MLDFEAVKLEIKELRNDLSDQSNDWRYIVDTVDSKLMDAWMACSPSVTEDEVGEIINIYSPEYKQVTRELYNVIIEIDDVVHSINSMKSRLLTLIDELRDSKTPWVL